MSVDLRHSDLDLASSRRLPGVIVADATGIIRSAFWSAKKQTNNTTHQRKSTGVNNDVERIFGYPRSELVGQNVKVQ